MIVPFKIVIVLYHFSTIIYHLKKHEEYINNRC